MIWLTIKDLRHLSAITWARAGVPLQRIRELLGHASIAQTEIYAAYVASDAERQEIAAAISVFTSVDQIGWGGE